MRNVEWLVQRASEVRPGHPQPFCKEDLVMILLTANLEMLKLARRIEVLENELLKRQKSEI